MARTIRPIIIALVLLLLSGSIAQAQDATLGPTPLASPTVIASSAGKSLRGSRHCEILVLQTVASASGVKLLAWDATDARAEARRLGVLMVLQNGPRYLAFDQISAEIASSTEIIQGLAMRLMATLELPAGVMLQERPAYSNMVVERNTEYVYLAGQPVFELTAPIRDVYVMQSFLAAGVPDSNLAELGNLGDRLRLPVGWSFHQVVPEHDLHAPTVDGQATVIRDDVGNTYQLLPMD